MAVKKIGTLNKHENPSTNENEFDIEDYMNANWDKIKEVVDNNADELSETQTNKVDKVDGKGLSTEDYTTAEKLKLAGLNNYDDTETKEDIQDIKSEQTTQNTKLQELEDNQIHITTERAESINVQDASGQNAKINIFGISKQEGTPSPENSVEIENTTGNVKIMDYNKNFLRTEDLNHTSAGLNWQITDNEVKITGTTTAVCSTSNEIECFIPAGSYKFLAVNGASNLTYRIWLYSSKNELLKYPMSGEQFTLTENAVKYRLVFDNLTVGNTYNTTFNPMILLQTETDEEFEAHEEEVITFPLSQNQKMFEGSETKEDGIHHKRKQIELDGTETVIDSGYNETTHHFTIRPTDKAFGQMEILSNMFVNSTEATKVYSVVGNNSNANITFKMPLEYATVDSFKTFLAQQKQAGTPVIVEYPLSEEEVEEYTEEQQTQRDQLQNAKTYKTVTNVFTDNAEVEMNYIADTKTYVDNEINSIKEQLNTINELLSTTTTSAMLLDNMQSDLESEVL